jgi:cysteine desulfurase
METEYGNPSSLHRMGIAAEKAMKEARKSVAASIGAKDEEIFFTSGGTEADNMAVLGVVRAAAGPGRHVIATVIEHPAVLGPCEQLEREGVAVTRLRVGASGVIDPDDLRRALRPDDDGRPAR